MLVILRAMNRSFYQDFFVNHQCLACSNVSLTRLRHAGAFCENEPDRRDHGLLAGEPNGIGVASPAGCSAGPNDPRGQGGSAARLLSDPARAAPRLQRPPPIDHPGRLGLVRN